MKDIWKLKGDKVIWIIVVFFAMISILAVFSSSSFLASSRGISKARGLQALCDHLGCTMDDVAMVGDADNDLEALAAVGMPVAMGNATPEVKSLARLVVADNDHDGIAELIAHLNW